jgi:hypothetical protein
MDAGTLGLYVSLFRGRGDVYGHEEGRCVKEPLTRDIFAGHLDGTHLPIGVYPIVPMRDGYYVVWGCCDIDVEDLSQAVRLRDALRAVDITAWIERSRSKGYHVWVFSAGLTPASDMRRMLLLAHQVAEVPAREVNPKQETLSGNNYGNYVRLPYPDYTASTDKRRVLDDDFQPIPLEQFVGMAYATRVQPDHIAELAKLWVPPAPAVAVRNLDTCESVDVALVKLSPLGKVIWRDGPLEGRDRSSTLMRLAYESVNSGLNPSEVKVLITDADLRWGKYHLRANGEMEIDKIVQRVFR